MRIQGGTTMSTTWCCRTDSQVARPGRRASPACPPGMRPSLSHAHMFPGTTDRPRPRHPAPPPTPADPMLRDPRHRKAPNRLPMILANTHNTYTTRSMPHNIRLRNPGTSEEPQKSSRHPQHPPGCPQYSSTPTAVTTPTPRPTHRFTTHGTLITHQDAHNVGLPRLLHHKVAPLE